jgi:colicin import membrane protein
MKPKRWHARASGYYTNTLQEKKMSQKQAEVKSIAEYSATEAELAKLRARLKDAKYEVTTTAGMDLARKDRRELITLRVDLEKKRVEIKAPALERCKLIDAEAKRITGELLLLEKPIDEQIKAEEARKEEIAAEKRRQEEARVAQIQERIKKLNNIPLLAAGLPSAEMELFIARVEAQQIGADFAEFQQEATDAKAAVIDKLKGALTAVLAQEAEAERVRKEQEEEAKRLEALRLDQEQAAAVERARLAAERAELEKLREAERKRQEEADRIAAEKEAELNLEREKLRKEQEELNRKERERLAKEQAEQAERDRLARVKAEKEAEENRQAERKLAQEKHEAELAKCTSDHKTTLESILAAAEDQTLSAPAALQHIIILAKRGLGRKA